MSAQVVVRWSGKEFRLEATGTVGDLKEALAALTGISAARQKLLGLKVRGGKPVSDETPARDLDLRPGTKVMLIGSPDAAVKELQAASAAAAAGAKEKEEEEEEPAAIEVTTPAALPENLAKVAQRVATYRPKVLNAPRPGKKLLVLDIDSTLLDQHSSAERAVELARPGLHAFLAAVHAEYDIAIWSATDMTMIELKMEQLGVVPNPSFSILAYIDYYACISIYDEKSKSVCKTKPLAVIWGLYPELYGEHNTVIVDDVRHNFLMNPNNGLRIKAFRKYRQPAEDNALEVLGKYLLRIAAMPSFSGMNHSRWYRRHI